MAIFNITSKRDDNATVVPLPANAFRISTLEANRCSNPKVYQIVDQVVYHNGGNRKWLPGDTIYADQSLTTRKNLSGVNQDYNIINDGFITLNGDSEVINSPCR